MSQLSDALFTKTQQRVLGLLYGQPQRSFYTNEILRLSGMGVATVKRELDSLLTAGVLQMTKVGNQHHYQANPECVVYAELIGIVKKTVGLVGVIREVLLPLSDGIDCAFVFGSMASGKENAASDIDLMIIGDLSYADAVSALYPVQQILGREINPKIFSRQGWHHALKSNDVFAREIIEKPRMDVVGGMDGIGKIGGD